MSGRGRSGSRPGQRLASSLRAVRANPTLAAVTAEGLITRLGFSLVGFTLPLFALSLGMNVAEIGLLYALRTATVLAVKPVMGWTADRFGKKPTLVAAVTLRCLVGALLLVASQPWHLYAIRMLHGAMTAAREPSAIALIAEHGDRHRMASAFAWYGTARDLGKALGYAAAGLLLQWSGSFRAVFLIALLSSCGGLVTVVRFVREQRDPAAPATTPRQPRPAPHGPTVRRLLPYLAFGLTVAGSAEMMAGFYPVLATTYAHLTPSQAGLAASISGVGILVAGPLFGWLSDHVSRRFALSARGLANFASSLLYLLSPTFAGFTIAKVVDDTGKAAFRPTWGATLADVSASNPATRVRTMTALDTASSLGEAVGPLLAGLLLSSFGIPIMLAARAVLALTTELQALRLEAGAPEQRRGSEHRRVRVGEATIPR